MTEDTEKFVRAPRTITVRMQPEEREIIMPHQKTVLRLLQTLGFGLTTALVIRDGQLLTHDRAIAPGDTITLRVVTSSG